MVRVLSGLSDALAEKVAEVAPGIVRVEARRMRPASGILWSADGVIVTAHHTVHLDDDDVTWQRPKLWIATTLGRKEEPQKRPQPDSTPERREREDPDSTKTAHGDPERHRTAVPGRVHGPQRPPVPRKPD